MKYVLFLLAALAAVGLTATHAADPAVGDGDVVDAKGTIRLPEDFRARYTHLGSWFVPEGEASGFHDVYTQPDTVAAYRRTGRFPEGAVLVKELRGHDQAAMTTGNPNWANAGLKQWFVMVKDTRGRFPDNPNWGDGWGWALFQPGKDGNVSTNYQADCMGCHIPAKATDWVYTQGYPTLTTP